VLAVPALAVQFGRSPSSGFCGWYDNAIYDPTCGSGSSVVDASSSYWPPAFGTVNQSLAYNYQYNSAYSSLANPYAGFYPYYAQSSGYPDYSSQYYAPSYYPQQASYYSPFYSPSYYPASYPYAGYDRAWPRSLPVYDKYYYSGYSPYRYYGGSYAYYDYRDPGYQPWY